MGHQIKKILSAGLLLKKIPKKQKHNTHRRADLWSFARLMMVSSFASTAAHMHSTSVRVHRTPAMTAPSPVAAAAAKDARAALTAPFF